MSFVRFFISFIVYLAITSSAVFAQANESGGIVLMEVESVPAAGDWERQTRLGGAKGGYYIWEGNNAFAVSSAGRGTLTYRFRINRAGNYQFRFRSRIGEGNNRTESNDSWVRFPTGRNVAGEQPINTWTKVFMNTIDTWSWGSATVDGVGRPIRQFFSAGVHTVQVSGRSRGHALDQLVLYHYPTVSFSQARFDALTPSSTTTNQPAPPPVVAQPEPEPQPAPVPVVVAPAPPPAPEPEPEPTPEPVVVVTTQTQTPTSVVDPSVMQVEGLFADVYSGSALELFWNRQNELGVSYRIGVDGSTRDVTNGTSYFFDGLNSGQSYNFSVTTVSSTGAESAPVVLTVTAGGQTGSAGGDNSAQSSGTQSPQNASLVRYSSTAAELFWDRANTVENIVGTDVFRDGNYLTTVPGNSFFDGSRQPGQEYTYSLIAVDGAGGRSAPTEVTP